MDAPTPAPALLATGLRNPLATARPGLAYLRRSFVAAWESHGATGCGQAALAFVQAVMSTPEEHDDHVAVARWIASRHLRSPEAAYATN